MSHPHSILLVEDDENEVFFVRHCIAEIENAAALQVVQDGEAAIQYLSGEACFADRGRFPLPSLVLLDLKLPRKNGFEVLSWRRSRADLQRLPVIVFTSSPAPVDIDLAYSLGANAYHVKPPDLISIAELLQHLHAYWLNFTMLPDVNTPPDRRGNYHL